MELVVDGTEATEYLSCMFCTARCFKLHGHGGRGSKGQGSRSTSVVNGALPGPEGIASSKHRAPFFVKTVGTSTVRRDNCELHLPAFFFRDYSDRFQKFVLLQGPSGQVWPVNLNVTCGTSSGRPTVRFSRGWKPFALDHDLELGDKLIFTLVSFSRFSVQVFDSLGKKKPNSGMAVSGWKFHTEGLLDVVFSRPKKTFHVNWAEKVVQEFEPGSIEEQKKVDDVGNRHTKASLLYRHFKREGKKLQRKSGNLVSCRMPKNDKALVRPGVPVLGENRIKKIDSLFSDSEFFSRFQEVVKGNVGFTKLLSEKFVDFKRPANLPMSQTMPQTGDPIEHHSLTLNKTQLLQNSVDDFRSKPVINVSAKAIVLDPSTATRSVQLPKELSQTREVEHNGRNLGVVKDGARDPCVLFYQKDTDTGLVSPLRTEPLPTALLEVDPIITTENLMNIDKEGTPGLSTASLSQRPEAIPPEEPADGVGGERQNFLPKSQMRSSLACLRNAVQGKCMEGSEVHSVYFSECPTLLREDIVTKPSHGDASSSPLVDVVSVGAQTATLHNKCGLEDRYAAESPLMSISDNHFHEVGTSGDSGIRGLLEIPNAPTPAVSTRSDSLSMMYFLYQPRPKVRTQKLEENDPFGIRSPEDGSIDSSSAVHHLLEERDKNAAKESPARTSIAASALAVCTHAGSQDAGVANKCTGDRTRSPKLSDTEAHSQLDCPAGVSPIEYGGHQFGSYCLPHSNVTASRTHVTSSSLTRALAGFSTSQTRLDERTRSNVDNDCDDFDRSSGGVPSVPVRCTAEDPPRMKPLQLDAVSISPIDLKFAALSLSSVNEASRIGRLSRLSEIKGQARSKKRNCIEEGSNCSQKKTRTEKGASQTQRRARPRVKPRPRKDPKVGSNLLSPPNLDHEFDASQEDTHCRKQEEVADVKSNILKRAPDAGSLEEQAGDGSQKKTRRGKGSSRPQRRARPRVKPKPGKDPKIDSNLLVSPAPDHEFETSREDAQCEKQEEMANVKSNISAGVPDAGSRGEQSGDGVGEEETLGKETETIVSGTLGAHQTSDSATQIISVQIHSDPSNQRASSSPPGEKLQKLRPALRLVEQARTNYMIISRRDMCDLTELEDIDSEDDERSE